MTQRIAIVGGGISGLSAAYRLLQRGTALDLPLAVSLFEAAAGAGGQIRTVRHEGIPLEAGPDTLVQQKPAGIELCRELGLEDELLRLDGKPLLQLLHDGRLVGLPDGFAMIAPTRLGPLWRSPLFSWRGKLRIACERWLPGRPPVDGDESLRSFVTRRLGREAFERVAEPIVAGLFTADADRMSLASTLPRFLELERSHGSVIRGLRAAAKSACPARGGMVTLRGGMDTLVRRLIERMPQLDLRLGTAVQSVSRERRSGAWRIALGGGAEQSADAVLLACPAPAAARLLRPLDEELAGRTGRIEFASCATVNLLYARRQVDHVFDGHGFFVPRSAALPLLACSFVSAKFAGRWPADRVLLRAFLGGAREPRILEHDDAALIARTHAALAPLLGLHGAPLHAAAHRSPGAMPQLSLGHPRRVEAIRKRVARHRGLALCGSALGHIGLPDCIASGRGAADKLLEVLAAERARLQAAS